MPSLAKSLSDQSVQALFASTAPVDVTKAAAAVGVGSTLARADHKHDISTAAPSAGLGTADAEGSASSLARSDHVHLLKAYAWTWANAAARNSQAGLTASHVGLLGFQTDMALAYRLMAVSPARWARLDDPDFITLGFGLGYASGQFNQVNLNTLSGQIGSFAARTLTNTNKATSRMRAAWNTAAASAGSTLYGRSSGGQQVFGGGTGWRWRWVGGPGAVCADMIWYAGGADNAANGAAVNAISTLRNGILIGADSGNSGQLGIITASGSASSFTALGANFPGLTAGEIYDVEFYSPDGAPDIRYQVYRLSNGNEVSGTVSAANMPTLGNWYSHHIYGTNNATAQTVTLDLSAIYVQQRWR